MFLYLFLHCKKLNKTYLDVIADSSADDVALTSTLLYRSVLMDSFFYIKFSTYTNRPLFRLKTTSVIRITSLDICFSIGVLRKTFRLTVS